MRQRLLLGPVLILILILGFWLDEVIDGVATPAWLGRVFVEPTLPPGVVAFVVCVLLSVIASRELAVIFKSKGIAASRRVMTTSAMIGLLVSTMIPVTTPGPVAAAVVSTAAVVVLVGSMVFYARRRTVEGLVAAAGGALLAFVYLGLMFGFVLAVRREHSAWVLLWVLLTTKSADIGAYFTGTLIGRHKLIPWISPGKTWEGLIGGVLFAAGIGASGVWLLGRAGVPTGMPVWSGAIAGALFALVGQAGDLLASLFKRDAGKKDSGRILPGFGGILDVLDSPLLVLPLAYWWLRAWTG